MAENVGAIGLGIHAGAAFTPRPRCTPLAQRLWPVYWQQRRPRMGSRASRSHGVGYHWLGIQPKVPVAASEATGMMIVSGQVFGHQS
jgi:hypothetical protein